MQSHVALTPHAKSSWPFERAAARPSGPATPFSQSPFEEVMSPIDSNNRSIGRLREEWAPPPSCCNSFPGSDLHSLCLGWPYVSFPSPGSLSSLSTTSPTEGPLASASVVGVGADTSISNHKCLSSGTCVAASPDIQSNAGQLQVPRDSATADHFLQELDGLLQQLAVVGDLGTSIQPPSSSGKTTSPTISTTDPRRVHNIVCDRVSPKSWPESYRGRSSLVSPDSPDSHRQGHQTIWSKPLHLHGCLPQAPTQPLPKSGTAAGSAPLGGLQTEVEGHSAGKNSPRWRQMPQYSSSQAYEPSIDKLSIRRKAGIEGEQGRDHGLSTDLNDAMCFGKTKKPSLYKTELCRSYEEKGHCDYGSKCQFAHGKHEIRAIQRHPKWKTELCRTFWRHGSCPYAKRCCFIHETIESRGLSGPSNAEEPVVRQPLFARLRRGGQEGESSGSSSTSSTPSSFSTSPSGLSA